MKNYLKLIIISLFTMVTILGSVLISNIFKNNNINTNYIITETRNKTKIITSSTTTVNTFYVTVEGEVIYKGTYTFSSPVTVKEVIELCGGFTSIADTSLKSSEALIDSDTLIVVSSITSNSYVIKEGEKRKKVNINTASLEELKKIDGIGNVKANKIIEYRTVNGFYKSIEDLYIYEIFTKDFFDKIKDQITVW